MLPKTRVSSPTKLHCALCTMRLMSRATEEKLHTLDVHCRRMIALSPFWHHCDPGTQGRRRFSPRRSPGLRARARRDIAAAPRPGWQQEQARRILQSARQSAHRHAVPGALGMNETLRVNGTARITYYARVLHLSVVNGRPPKLWATGSKLWDATQQIDRAILPSYAEMLLDHVRGLSREEKRAPVSDHGRAWALLKVEQALR